MARGAAKGGFSGEGKPVFSLEVTVPGDLLKCAKCLLNPSAIPMPGPSVGLVPKLLGEASPLHTLSPCP